MIIKICANCNKKFSAECNKRKFCSHECQWKNLKIIKKNRISKKCEWCESIFGVIKARIKTAKYCSIGCYNKSKKGKHCFKNGERKNPIGENHWNWKGGITELNHSERCRFYKTFRKLVFERDNYTCQICGSRGLTLHADHIKSWSKYPKLRFDLNNCRTLCVNCHFEITFGKKPSADIKTWGRNYAKGFLCL